MQTYDPAVHGDRVALAKDGSCWLEITSIPDAAAAAAAEDFDDLFALHPDERASIVTTHGDAAPRFRWQKSFLRTPPCPTVRTQPYMFGCPDEDLTSDLPPQLAPLFGLLQRAAGAPFNQAVVNWFGGPRDHIALHTDWMEGMVGGEDMRISSLTLSQGDARMFVLNPTSPEAAEACLFPGGLQVPTTHGRVVTMCGASCQLLYKHGIPPMKTASDASRRISITGRVYM
jgi:hypothetical protein